MRLRTILTKLIVIFLFFLFLFLFTKQSHSISEFQTNYKITYEIGPRGNANVTQEIVLTNNFSNIYPQEYNLQISGREVENISANDSFGNILKEIKEEKETTKIKLEFNHKPVGKGESANFKIAYLLQKFAIKQGQVWEIAIPKIANISEIDELEMVVKVPIPFGKLSYSSIPPSTQNWRENYQEIIYKKKQLDNKPIVLAFGEFQIFDFSLNFQLENNYSTNAIAKIPIPPETAYQSIVLTKIQPVPEKIELDYDYNWLAVYSLEPKEKININVNGQVKIFSQPENIKFSELDKNQNLSEYLAPDYYWEVDNQIIKQLALSYNSPEKIFNFTVENLTYDYQKLNNSQRLGGLKSLEGKKGVCTEFSDLFVTLSRAAKIPARELEGFALTQDKTIVSLSAENDVLHSWAEYWDENKKNWIPVDPTWSKTTGGMNFLNYFDLSHFVFVIHGKNSQEPIPPGSYKNQTEEKNIFVEFSSQLAKQPKVEFDVYLEKKEKKLEIVIKNKSLASVFQTEVEMGNWGKEHKEEKFLIGFLPPLGEKRVEIAKPNFLKTIFKKPEYYLWLNNDKFTVYYPGIKLNFIKFFANLLGK